MPNLVELLKDAETLKQAFEILRKKEIGFEIAHTEDCESLFSKILLPKHDYIILELSTFSRPVLHPYGTNIFYEPYL